MDTTVADPLIGRVLDGRYAVEERIASGGMATVYRGTDTRLDRTVAIKVMSATYAGDPAFLARFTREARAAARLSSPYIVGVYDQGEDAGTVFLVMEYVDGRTLRAFLRERGRLSPRLALAVIEPVAAALAAAHRAGLVHRDVKPENVLISRDGDVKVADFGVARAVEASATTATTGLIMGTFAYLAPERITHGVDDERTDVYALGIMLYELLTGAPPFTGDNAHVSFRHVHDDVPPPSAVEPAIPVAVDDLVVRASRRDPAQRPVDAGAFLAELRHAADSLPPEPIDLTTVAGDTKVIDRDATRLLKGTTAGAGHTLVVGRTPPPYPPPTEAAPGAERPRRRWRRGLAVVLALLVLTGAAIGAGLYYGKHRTAAVPSFIGKDLASAQSLARTSHVDLANGSAVFSERVPAGRIVSQDPSAGHKIARGGTVTVHVSRGPDRVHVPSVVGQSLDAATSALEHARLTVGATKQVYDEKQPTGTVLATDPQAGTLERPGSAVTLTVSKGRRPIPAPDVTGKKVADARSALAKLGLTSQVSEAYSDTVAKGVVISQQPDPGATLHRGDAVALVVSKGPELVVVPDLYGDSEDQAKQALAALGLKIKVQRLLFGSGHVLDQTPAAGTKVRKGTTVTVRTF